MVLMSKILGYIGSGLYTPLFSHFHIFTFSRFHIFTSHLYRLLILSGGDKSTRNKGDIWQREQLGMRMIA